jgi:mono/diheme cytochrome c family protein
MSQKRVVSVLVAAVALSVSGALWNFARQDTSMPPCRKARPNTLHVPDTLYLRDFEKDLYRFLFERQYAALNWCVDKDVRDTGPWTEGSYYGTHPAVRVYYSPEVMYWLTGDPSFWADGNVPPKAPREGEVPDGGMIVKEMFAPPALLYQELRDDPKYKDNAPAYEQTLASLVAGYTVMIRDSKGSKDGWFWAGPGVPKPGQTITQAIDAQLDDYSHILYSGFGLPCLRCHSSAAEELTFSSLSNIAGFLPEEDPLRFRTDNSWRTKAHFSDYPLSKIAADKYVQRMFMTSEFEKPWTDDRHPDAIAFLEQHLVHYEAEAPAPPPAINPDFVAAFPPLPRSGAGDIRAFPKQWADHVTASVEGAEHYVTSDNCLGCHGGLGGAPDGVTMFLTTGPKYGDGFNISEYGEWRWSPMGLAGRDPIFYAQLESEMAYIARDARTPGLLHGSAQDTQQATTNLCLSCHGAMGQRQLQIDAAKDASLSPNFKTDYVYLSTLLSSHDSRPGDYAYHKYGELAREGISCTVCHHINPPDPGAVDNWSPEESGWISNSTPKELAYMLFHNSTGRYNPGPADELNGPYEKVAEVPMKNSLGVAPVDQVFVKDSQLCGTCHTINLPNIGMTENPSPVLTAAGPQLVQPPAAPYPHTLEQATFVEWQNSAFAGSDFQSCQDCHMPKNFKSADPKIDVDQLVTQIATIQDTTYPQTEHEAPADDIRVATRDDYSRHEHVGLNVFLLEMFRQFTNILGVDMGDYMTSAKTGNALAIQNMVRQAQEDTVDLDVRVAPLRNNVVTADVTVTNKTGHRFPSGVAFRRAFLEFSVLNGDKVIWSSGSSNSVGVILGADGKPLPSEFLPDRNTYQPHYQTITSPDQVQIYEELNQDANQEFTTSFIHRVQHIKDNRLLPKGWRESSHFRSQGAVMEEFMEATDPNGVGNDPDYRDQGPSFPGQDHVRYVATLPAGTNTQNLRVKVTMYYQAIPPYWLYQRFTANPDGPDTRRLYYLTSHLNPTGTPIEDWKLQLVSETRNGTR